MIGGEIDLGNGKVLAWFGNATFHSTPPPKNTDKPAYKVLAETQAMLTDFKNYLALRAAIPANSPVKPKVLTELDRRPDESLKAFEARMFEFIHPGKTGLNSR